MSTVTVKHFNQGLSKEELSLIIGDRNNQRRYDVIACVRKLQWETKRLGAPGKLVFSLLVAKDMAFWEGDKVTFSVNSNTLFVGYIFEKEKNEKGEIEVICFDQLRYLKARQSYNFTGQSAGDIIKKIAGDFRLQCGTLENTGYVIPSLIMDNQTCLDTIFTALELTTDATGRSYNFYDQGGVLHLTASTAMVSPYILGEETFASSYSYVTSINHGVHNSIKLIRPNADTGMGDVYMAQSADAIKKWGLLQLYDTVDRELNPGEIREMAKTVLLKENRLQRTLTLRCIGIPEIRSGHVVKVELATMGDLAANHYMTTNRVVHTWDEKGHLMDLEFSVFREGDLDYAISMSEFSEYYDIVKKEPKSSSKSLKTAKAAKKKKSSSKSSDSSKDEGSGSYGMPFHGTYRLSTPFNKSGRTWSCGWHTGVDYVGISDKNIYAICRGTVIAAGTKPSYGKCVQVRHVDGYTSVYAHLSVINVSVGQSVTTNTKIGREGSTGKTFGPHLHLELHKGPYRYPPKPKVNPHTYILTH